MVSDDGQDLDIPSDVLPEEVEDIAVPMPLVNLEPWHRPRKQFIRERQWVNCARILLKTLKKRNATSIQSGKIRYLTLPGVDYFDVEVIGTLAAREKLHLEALGFLTDLAKASVNARSQVRMETLIKRGLITDTSVTYPYRFEDLASEGSQAYREAKTRGPFNIINVDACGSIALPDAKHSERIINALFRLVELQLNLIREPWLLYLTSDVREDSVSKNVIERLDDAIRKNAEESKNFRLGVVNGLGAVGQKLEDVLMNADGVPEKFLTKFSLGLAKWLIHNASEQKWDVMCRPFFCYSTRKHGEQGPSMSCLAFEFRPRKIVMQDVVGAIDSPNGNKGANLGVAGAMQKYSMEALCKAIKMKDVDKLFAGNDNLAREFAVKQRKLMADAGYKEAALTEFDDKYFP